jgi:hypothetical protein
MIFGIQRVQYLKVIPECQDLAKLWYLSSSVG